MTLIMTVIVPCERLVHNDPHYDGHSFAVWAGAEGTIWPVATLPAWTSPVGAVDKKGKPLEKRRISNGSAPYRRPRAWENAHGDETGVATGPECASFNELAGPMRPPHDAVVQSDPILHYPVGLSL